MSESRPSARLEAPAATKKGISSVAYAVEEMASDEKTASATRFVSRWCSCSVVARGRPSSTRLTTDTVLDSPALAVGDLTVRRRGGVSLSRALDRPGAPERGADD